MASTDALVLGDYGIKIVTVSAHSALMGSRLLALGRCWRRPAGGGRLHSRSAELCISLDQMHEPQRLDFERYLRPEIFVTSKAPGIQCLAYGLLDLALRSDATAFRNFERKC
jgi:hypothetical protein